ncbi:MAG: thioredoxin domain-containing protein [Ignavibacteriae bacterium]|nr:thioredoxin domain-containing protein [Ignavibacteriota bacterium]MCB9244164.1 thioredoxin domain-containing protein [Ignavibacteriales bacterium]
MEDPVENTKPGLKRSLIIVILFFALIGSALALYATRLTFKLTVAGIIEPSECSFSDLFTCDTVLSTGYAKMFGVPVAWFGFMYFFWALWVAIFALVNSRKQSGTAALNIIFFMTTLSVLVTFFKMYQLFMLGVICPVCVAMYVCIFVIFFLTMKALRISFKEILSRNLQYVKSIFSSSKPVAAGKKGDGTEERVSQPWRYWIILIWLFAMGFLGLRYYENTVIKPGLKSVQLILTQHFNGQKYDVNFDGSAVDGNPDAKVTIVEFSDFECPACKLLASNMKPIMLEYGDRVSLHFMNYPLDKSINKNLTNEIHQNAGIAAIAGVCAQDQGKFWDFYYTLYENQTKINRDFIIATAQELGLDMNKFNDCLESDPARDRVLREIDLAKEYGITGTPTLFINGRKVHYWNSPEVIKAIIDEELKMNK